MNESPLTAAHEFANLAEEYVDMEQWEKAFEAHENAAKKFLQALNHTSDIEATRTLKLLYADHIRRAKEVKRRISRKEPVTLITPSNNSIGNTIITSFKPKNSSSNSFVSTSTTSSLNTLKKSPTRNNGGVLPQTIEESYMVLNEEDESDPFNKFLSEIEQIANRLSNPVAFAMAPLSAEESTKVQILETEEKLKKDKISIQDSFYFVPKSNFLPSDTMKPLLKSSNEKVSKSIKTGKVSMDSLPKPNKTLEEYAIENEQLKTIIDELSRKLAYYSKQAEEANMLRSSIMQFRADVQRQVSTRRIMQSQDLTRSAASTRTSPESSYSGQQNIQTSSLGQGQGQISGQMLGQIPSSSNKRVKELEEEIKILKLESDKQQTIIERYKERWEKLKASARKKRSEAKEKEVANNVNNNSNISNINNSNNLIIKPTPRVNVPIQSRVPIVKSIPPVVSPPPFSRTTSSPNKYRPSTSSPLANQPKDPS